jgi:hypothetical protein
MKEKYPGFLMMRELENADKVMKSAKKPFVAIMGGAKVSDKILIIEQMLNKVDVLIIGGGMSYTFLKAQGYASSPSPGHGATADLMVQDPPDFDEMLVSPIPSSVKASPEDPTLAVGGSSSRKRGCCDAWREFDSGSASAAGDANGGAAKGSGERGEACPGYLVEEALREAFLRTDAEFTSFGASDVGTTAVVAVVGERRMWVANCGDSRVVLCRSGRAVQLTDDHKPDREDEAVSCHQCDVLGHGTAGSIDDESEWGK